MRYGLSNIRAVASTELVKNLNAEYLNGNNSFLPLVPRLQNDIYDIDTLSTGTQIYTPYTLSQYNGAYNIVFDLCWQKDWRFQLILNTQYGTINVRHYNGVKREWASLGLIAMKSDLSQYVKFSDLEGILSEEQKAMVAQRIAERSALPQTADIQQENGGVIPS